MGIHEVLARIELYIINITLIVSSGFFLFKYSKKAITFYSLGLLLLNIIDFIIQPYIKEGLINTNYHLFSISYYFNFLYLTYYFFHYLFKIRIKYYFIVAFIGAIPLIFRFSFQVPILNWEANDRIIYNSWIVVLSLISVFNILHNTNNSLKHLYICFGILSFFVIDLSMIFSFNYYLNKNYFEILAWVFNHFRFLLLEFYFIVLFYQSSKLFNEEKVSMIQNKS